MILTKEKSAILGTKNGTGEGVACLKRWYVAHVRIIKGPLTGLVGELVALDGKSKIAVRLDMLGCACVDMPIGYVEQIGERN